MSVLPIPSILDEVKEKGVRKTIYSVVDRTVESLTAGMNIQDIREALRGDKPSRRPNPRLTPHTDSFWFHMRPSYYHNSVVGIYPTFRLGWLSTYFFVLEIITGLFLMIFYTPSPDVAYANMQNIMGNVPMGQFMRDLHRLGAEGMVAIVCLHMLRTFVSGTYKKPRQFTWLTGVILLLLTLGLSFTGYLLPWDQLAFWAVTIGTSMAEAAPPEVVGTNVNLILRGAPDIGANGLLRFYLLHVFALPLLTAIFIGVHYYKVVIHGHGLPPRAEEIGKDTAKKVPIDNRTYFIPDVMANEIAWIGMVTFILVVAVTWFFHAPLENHADPQATPLHTVAPWYFLWIQGLLKLGDKTLMGIIVPTIVFAYLAVMPYLDTVPSRRFAHRRVALMNVSVVVAILAVLTYMGSPWYAVDTAADTEVQQELIPGEGVGPVRSIPYDELVANITARGEETLWLSEIDTLNTLAAQLRGSESPDPMAYDAAIFDKAIAPYSITITEDNLGELEETYADEYSGLWHVLEELHHLLYEEFPEVLPNAIGYLSISQKQENLVRVYLLMTWEVPILDSEGDPTGKVEIHEPTGQKVRAVSGKVVFINQESEWHEH